MADAIITARHRCTVVNVDLATATAKPFSAGAREPVDFVSACSAVQTWIILAFVDIDFALSAGKAGHAHTTEGTRIVQAATVILTRMTFALVDICFAAWSGKALRAIARKRAGRIHTDAIVFAR